MAEPHYNYNGAGEEGHGQQCTCVQVEEVVIVSDTKKKGWVFLFVKILLFILGLFAFRSMKLQKIENGGSDRRAWFVDKNE